MWPSKPTSIVAQTFIVFLTTDFEQQQMPTLDFPILLKFVLSSIILLEPTINLSCIQSIFNDFPHHRTMLVAAPKSQNPLILLYKFQLNTTFLIVDEDYKRHYSETGILVNFGLVTVDNYNQVDILLGTIKRSRIISVKMHLLVFVREACDELCCINAFKRTRQIVNPFFAAIVTGNTRHILFTTWANPFPQEVYQSNNCSFRGISQKAKIPEGYTLKATVAHQDPYVRIGQNTRDGIEIRIIEALAKNLNMKLKYVDIPANENPREVKPINGSYIGLLGMLYRFDADIMAGGMVVQEPRTNVVEMIYSHTDDSLKYFISVPPVVNNFGAILSVFSPRIWILIITVFASFSMTYAIVLASAPDLKVRNVISISLLQTYSLLFDQELLKTTKTMLSTVLLIFYFAYSLIITNSYRSSLITTLTSEAHSKWFESPDEVIAAGQKIYLYRPGFHFFIEAAQVDPLWTKILLPERHEFITEYSYSLLNKLYDKKQDIIMCITLTCKSIINQGLLDKNMNPKLVTLGKKFIRFPVTIFLSPGSPLLEIFRDRLCWMSEAGLVRDWKNRIAFSDKIKTMFHKMTDSYENGPKKLTLQHLEPVFIMLATMLSTAALSFLIESFKKM